MEPEPTIPPITKLTIPTQVSQPAKPKRSKFKNFLLAFFLIEHIIIILILLIPVFFMIRAYAFSDFGQLNEKAINFTPKDQKEIISDYTGRYMPYVYTFLQSKEDQPKFDFEFAEDDINSMLYGMDIDYIEKYYVSFADENIIYIWLKTTKFPYPLMFKTWFNYEHENNKFEYKFLDWQVGSLSFPGELLEFAEDSIIKVTKETIDKYTKDYPIDLTSMQSTDCKFKMTLQVTDKIQLIEMAFRALYGNYEELNELPEELPSDLPSKLPFDLPPEYSSATGSATASPSAEITPSASSPLTPTPAN